ncbi:MAG: peptidylprolyl isomerase [Bacteroidetes bacterium]|nr:peptidylprolyl isomerase [Bacteroidota bacterium]
MKPLFIFLTTFIFSSSVFCQADPIIMEIGQEKVTKSEFLQIYLKNNNNPKFDKESMDEYMTLFKKFKLKVAEAEALGYDTIPTLIKELQGYRKQLATPYLTDSTMSEYLVKEAYERTLNEVRASHILFRLNSNASPADTLASYNRIMELRNKIIAGADFATVAKEKGGSEDPSVKSNGGDLGFFTAFQMVSPFEDAAYATPVGSISMPVRTKFGYHLLKVTDSRPARGVIQAAHIMVAANSNSSDDEKQSAIKKINEIYEQLIEGGNFEELAKQFSDDPSTSSKGGLLPVFGSGTSTRMVSNFEDAAFSIEKDGGISAPIQTEYGYHIIKRISLSPLKSYDEMKKELQSKVNRDERAKKTQDSFVSKLKKEYHFKEKCDKNKEWFYTNMDSSQVYLGEWKAENLKKNKPLFVLDKKKIRQRAFVDFLNSQSKTLPITNNVTLVDSQYDLFVKQAILDYEDSRLEQKYPAFKALMQEYHDGILLYEVMSDKVWNKAIKDTTGLKEYFESNRSKYQWKERYDAVIYECSTKEIAKDVHTMILNDTINSKDVLDKINKDSELNLKVRTNKYEWQDTDFLKDQSLKLGVNSAYLFDGKHYVVKIDEIIAPTNKELLEAKGAVTSDFQNQLEKDWLETLMKKYPIKVNNTVLYSLGK